MPATRLTVLLLAALAAATPSVARPEAAARADAGRADCAASGRLVPYCGVPFPEDLEPLPGGGGVIASDMHLEAGPHGVEPGQGVLKRVDLATGAVVPLYPLAPAGRPVPAAAMAPRWGDAACPGEIGAALLPHGIHLSRRPDGRMQLLVVNHGGRESVEFFELTGRGEGMALRWRGCVVPPASSHLNDVAALPDGGFLVSTMRFGDDAGMAAATAKAERGEDTGFLWRWDARGGVRRQPGSASPLPNGVQVDAAGRFAYIATASRGGDVRKLDIAAGKVVASVAVPNPDNLSWSKAGRLLVAGVAAGAKPMACFRAPGRACFHPSAVYAVAVGTMAVEPIFASAGAPVSAATVAVQAGGDLLIGSCFGDRFVAVRGLFETARRP